MIEIKQLSDEGYHSFGGFNIKNPQESVISASLLKDVFNRGLLESILEQQEVSPQLEQIFKNGSIVHMALLEPEEFKRRYYTGDLNPLEARERIEPEIANLIREAKAQISLKYPKFFKEGLNEISFVGDLDGVAVKAKMDKVVVRSDYVEIIDIKTTALKMEKIKKTPDGRAWEIDRTINDYHIDLQMFFYKKLIEEHFLCTKGYVPQILTSLLFISKEDCKVRKIRLSEATLARGEEKFKSIWEEIKAFCTNGISAINDFEII